MDVAAQPDAVTRDPAPTGVQGSTRSRLTRLARPTVIFSLLLFVFCVALFSPSLNNGFAMDDRSLIKENAEIRELAGIPDLWRQDYWHPKLESGLYRPVVTTSYALNYAIGSGNAWTYHVVNVLLHAAISVLVFALFFRISRDLWLSGGASVLFAAHAVHTEPVANVASGRPEFLGGLFFLLALHASLTADERSGGPSRAMRAASLACFGFGLLCKESVATLLGVLAMHDVLRVSDELGLMRRIGEALRTHWVKYTGYVAVVVAVTGARFAVLGVKGALPPEIGIDNPLVFLNPDWRVLNALAVAFRYLGLFVFPRHLSYDYSFDQIRLVTSLKDPIAISTLVGTAALVFCTVWAWRRSRQTFYWLGFFGITFAIVSNVVLPIGTILGERLLYMPSIGLCMLLAMAVMQLARALTAQPSRIRAVFVVLMATVVGLHMARTLARIEDWKTEERLYLRDYRNVPRSAKAMNNAAAMMVSQERYEEAIELFERATTVVPGYVLPWQTGAHAFELMNRPDDALRMYEGAVRAGSDALTVLNNLGFALVDRETDIPRGVALLERALEKYPDHPEVLDSLGWGYYKLGRLDEAREKIRRSLEVDSWSNSTEDRRKRLDIVEEALKRKASASGSPTTVVP